MGGGRARGWTGEEASLEGRKALQAALVGPFSLADAFQTASSKPLKKQSKSMDVDGGRTRGWTGGEASLEMRKTLIRDTWLAFSSNEGHALAFVLPTRLPLELSEGRRI